MQQEPEVWAFFHQIKRGELSMLEVRKKIKQLTGNDPEKMKQLLNEFQYFLKVREERRKNKDVNLDYFHNDLKETIANVKPGKKAVKLKPGTPDVHSHSLFEEIFYHREDVEPAIRLLKKSNPRVIDDDCTYTLNHRSKASIVAWVDHLKEKNKIKTGIPDGTLAKLLNSKFPGLRISDRTLRSAETKVSALYGKYKRQY
jgi:hypothetical protein